VLQIINRLEPFFEDNYKGINVIQGKFFIKISSY